MGHRLAPVVALWLVGGVAVASPAAPVATCAKIVPLGWTADGRYFAFRAHEDVTGAGDPDADENSGGDYSADFGAVVDAATGKLEYYLSALDGAAPAERRRELGPPRDADFKRWLAAHAPKLVEGRRDAHIALGKLKDRPPITGDWDGARWSFSDDAESVGAGGAIGIAIGHDAKKGVVLRLSVDGGAGQCRGSIMPVWSPDGRRVAWWVHHGLQIAEFPAYDELWLTGARPPRVLVKPDKRATPGARDAALRTLDGAGFEPVVGQEAEAQRATTVVYAAPGFEAEGRRAAAALGGTLDKLTWKADADLVIALGAGGRATQSAR